MLPTLYTDFSISFLYFTLQVDPRPAAPETSACTQSLLFLDKGVIQKITDLDLTVASAGLSLVFPYFLPRQRFQSPSHGRPPREPVACKRRRRRHSAGPHAYAGLPSVHSISGMEGSTEWHRPSGRWNLSVWISCHWRRKYGQSCAPTTGGATEWGALPHAYPIPVEHMTEWGWGCNTGPTGGGASPRASTGRTWWSARSGERCQRWVQGEGWRQCRMRCWWWFWFWGWKC